MGDRIRCAFARFVEPLSGEYCVVPSVEALARFGGCADRGE
ncbi:hypothetical protein [Jatrophihabitans endophyticus]|nr:hypothetical protein [Jatrophihabitans endophyticus]